MGFLGLLPSAEGLVNADQLQFGKIFGVFVGDFFQARPVVILGRDFLGFLAVEVFQIGLGYFLGAVVLCSLVQQGHRRLGKDAQAGGYDFEFILAQLIDR